MNSYLDFLLSEVNTMTENQLAMLLWEPIIESSDTTLISTEWALFELAKDPARQVALMTCSHIDIFSLNTVFF